MKHNNINDKGMHGIIWREFSETVNVSFKEIRINEVVFQKCRKNREGFITRTIGTWLAEYKQLNLEQGCQV